MLLSSVTLGLFSDKVGRLRCIQLAFVISMLANLAAILAHDYYLFSACVLLMSYAQVGAANALCTLVMEAITPRLRFLPILEYGAGWSFGTVLVPLINTPTRDYRLYLAIMLSVQVLMLPWLHWGVFESIRWLLSEGHVNRSQIELRRACRMNRVQTGAKLAQNIAQIQVQQVRKASRVIDDELAPARLAKALESELTSTTQELDMLSAAIKHSFGLDAASNTSGSSSPSSSSGDNAVDKTRQQVEMLQCAPEYPASRRGSAVSPLEVLSPTLARKSFSIEISPPQLPPASSVELAEAHEYPASSSSSSPPPVDHKPAIRRAADTSSRRGTAAMQKRVSLAPPPPSHALTSEERAQIELQASSDPRQSLTTQALIQLALKYSKTVQQVEEGGCFLVQMLHRKLRRQTLVLILVSIMYESSYYGFVQSNKFVGQSVEWNYVFSALCELLAAIVACLMLAYWSRKFSLILATLLGSLCCFAMALTYWLVPDERHSAPFMSIANMNEAPLRMALDQVDSQVIVDSMVPASALANQSELIASGGSDDGGGGSEHLLQIDQRQVARVDLLALRQLINLALMLIGRFVVAVGIQVAAMIAMESYPNNLRQTGSGAILFVGRICSIMSPFLFNDAREDKLVLKWTLTSLGAIGLLVCLLIPLTVRDQKDKDICDRMNEIED